ncbi:hypothetical protein BDF20DRAFT_987564 [Mycotypha africana]|uniref:uncharacterized protein n=1 Tax=Mycotypha africana TaxID=64632 RepID=UPI002300E43E|nr:uncharacterized protein BDF20DRAFT_987564 [Mycotypha africana]KAI8979266.1 hypothetical protein BDF20DRAFT_987564 [Mycotypha africana]
MDQKTKQNYQGNIFNLLLKMLKSFHDKNALVVFQLNNIDLDFIAERMEIKCRRNTIPCQPEIILVYFALTGYMAIGVCHLLLTWPDLFIGEKSWYTKELSLVIFGKYGEAIDLNSSSTPRMYRQKTGTFKWFKNFAASFQWHLITHGCNYFKNRHMSMHFFEAMFNDSSFVHAKQCNNYRRTMHLNKNFRHSLNDSTDVLFRFSTTPS